MRKQLTSLVCLAACVLCLGGQSTCQTAADLACDTFTEQDQDDLAQSILDRLLDELGDGE